MASPHDPRCGKYFIDYFALFKIFNDLFFIMTVYVGKKLFSYQHQYSFVDRAIHKSKLLTPHIFEWCLILYETQQSWLFDIGVLKFQGVVNMVIKGLFD